MVNKLTVTPNLCLNNFQLGVAAKCREKEDERYAYSGADINNRSSGYWTREIRRHPGWRIQRGTFIEVWIYAGIHGSKLSEKEEPQQPKSNVVSGLDISDSNHPVWESLITGERVGRMGD
jgi:hypothetical protein